LSIIPRTIITPKKGVEPNESVEERFRRHGIGLGFPNFRVGEKSVHEKVMCGQEHETEQAKAGKNEMKDGQQTDVLTVFLSLEWKQ